MNPFKIFNIMMIVTIILYVLVLSACSINQPVQYQTVVIEKTIYVPDHHSSLYIQDIVIPSPPDVNHYISSSLQERTDLLTAYVVDLLFYLNEIKINHMTWKESSENFNKSILLLNTEEEDRVNSVLESYQ